MGNSVTAPFLTEDTFKERISGHKKGDHKKGPAKQSSDKENQDGNWRDGLQENSVVRVWDAVFQTSYPAVVTRVGEKDMQLKFCPKYPDGSYCGCVVNQRTMQDAKIVNPYVSTNTKNSPKKEHLLNAQCRTESLDHLSDMIWGNSGEVAVADHGLVLTKGPKSKPPPAPPAILAKQRLQSIDEYD